MMPPSPSSNDAVISITGLHKSFQRNPVLKDVTLHVPQGCVFGLVGENGAGKTTTIRHILGLLRPDEGAVSVCGADPVKDPVKVLSQVGYLSELRDLPGWMRVDELMSYTQAFYPNWDISFAETLREDFGLDPAKRIKHLSQGQQAKAGLLVALAYRPELLVLDEPSSGLDPVVRRDMLEVIIRRVANEGRTVFFSSHLLDEIERVCDHLAMIHQGELRLTGRLDDLRESYCLFTIQFDHALTEKPSIAKSLEVTGQGRHWKVLSGQPFQSVEQEIEALGAQMIDRATPGIDQIFFAIAKKQSSATQAV